MFIFLLKDNEENALPHINISIIDLDNISYNKLISQKENVVCYMSLVPIVSDKLILTYSNWLESIDPQDIIVKMRQGCDLFEAY